ncbi:MAG: efflux RND transporter periplasmic adaptor subunit [Hyphomonadaceae bacterium]|nr:efflux RND transporter periplasmic adaptor subunit [Hyphomonadaceae bacterium]
MTDTKLTGLALALVMALAGCGSDDDAKAQVASTVQSETADEHGDHDAHGEEEKEGDHADGDEHGEGEDGHDDHDDHGDEDGGDVVKLDAAAAAEAGIVVNTAETGNIVETVSLPTELRFDADRVARVATPVSGLVSRLDKGEGDKVRRGERLALLSSRELAELKADFLTAKSAENLAASSLVREERLFADKITSEADLDAARAALVSARVAREAVENKLHAVGISDAVLNGLTDAPDGALANAAILAPIDGTVISRSVSVGSSVEGGGEALFVIVDDSRLWADIAIYKADADKIAPGQSVILRTRDGADAARGEIALILPVIDEATRTGTARVIIDNPDGRLRPGQFVTAEIAIGEGGRILHVPANAVVEVEERASVFVPVEGGFAPRPVETGSSRDGLTEIRRGLSEGERFVSEGAFTLKAQLEKDAFGDGHAH